jgi:hypothetical protein
MRMGYEALMLRSHNNFKASIWIVLLILFLQTSFTTSELDNKKHGSISVPSYFVYHSEDYTYTYVMWMEIGDTLEKLMLEVRFDEDVIVLYRDQSQYSSTYSQLTESLGHSTDFVHLGSSLSVRTVVISDPEYSMRPKNSRCSECAGFMGFGSHSFVWRLFGNNGVTFGSFSIHFGDMSPLFKTETGKCKGLMVQCLPVDPSMLYLDGDYSSEEEREHYDPLVSSRSDTMCTFDGIIDGKNYKIILKPHSSETYLPYHLYNKYMDGKNIYKKDSMKNWEPIKISVDHRNYQRAGSSVQSSSFQRSMSHLNDIMTSVHDVNDITGCLTTNEEEDSILENPSRIERGAMRSNSRRSRRRNNSASTNNEEGDIPVITILEKHVISESLIGGSSPTVRSKKRLMIKSHNMEDDVIVIGNNVMRDLDVFKHKSSSMAMIQQSHRKDHYSVYTLLLLLMAFWCYVRWKMTDSTLNHQDSNRKQEQDDKNNHVRHSHQYSYRHYYLAMMEDRINLAFEFTGFCIAIIAYCLPFTTEALSGHSFLRVTIIIYIVVLMAIEIASIVLGMMASRPLKIYRKKKNGEISTTTPPEIVYRFSRRSTAMFIQVNINRNICHETILLTSAWLLLLERNMVEGISTPITALVNCACFYNMTSHIFMVTICYIKVYNNTVNRILFSRSIYANYIMLYGVVTPFLYSYQIYITYYYFLKPLFKRSLQSLEHYSTPLIIIIYIVMAGLALYNIKLYTGKCLRDMEENDRLERKNKKTN